MKIMCWEIELSTGIQVETIPCWLIIESKIEKQLESGIRKRSAIVIIVIIEKKLSNYDRKDWDLEIHERLLKNIGKPGQGYFIWVAQWLVMMI